MEEDTLLSWMQDDRLSDYRRYVGEILRGKAHTLDKKTEEILAKSRKMAAAATTFIQCTMVPY